MLDYLRDKLHTARLQARYRRILQERMVELVEGTGTQAVAPDPGRWWPLGESRFAETERLDVRTRARRLVDVNPHARNVLRLLEVYVVGPELALHHATVCDGTDHAIDSDDDIALRHTADELWRSFLDENRRHFTYREYARRAWRDGECFLRKFDRAAWPPTVRFVDPEEIGPTSAHPDSQGILTDPLDVESPRSYLRIDPVSREPVDVIPADEMFHTKIGVDSNQKRGSSLFAPLLDPLDDFDRWLEAELLARKLQSSIVLWRKVHGSPSQAAAFADAAASSISDDASGGLRRERIRPGTILTTSTGTELEFLQPDTNFGDALPLGRMLLLCAAAGAGLPEFMLTSDASNGNFASTMIAEGPAVKLFQSEQQFFAGEFEAIRRWVCGEAIRLGLLPDDFFDRVRPRWTFPQLVNRDRPRERTADARLVEAKVLSRAEVARRDGADPHLMQAEIAAEAT